MRFIVNFFNKKFGCHTWIPYLRNANRRHMIGSLSLHHMCTRNRFSNAICLLPPFVCLC